MGHRVLYLELERDAVERLNTGVDLCRARGDHGTRALLEKILIDEEEHVDWLEAQLEQIEAMGLQNYLAQQHRAGLRAGRFLSALGLRASLDAKG